MIRIAISGVGGRMGQAVSRLVKDTPDMSVVFGVDTYCQNMECPVFDSFDGCTLDVDVVVDFSNPSALDSILNYAEKTGARVVLATTGYSNEQLERIKYSAKKVAIFQSSNMSLGVNLLGKLAKDTARFLKNDCDIEIVETHHNKKIDAPSGTALTLAKEINKVRDNSLDLLCGRQNGKRNNHEIGIHSIRGGTIHGKHSIMFLGNGEGITLSHEAESKDVFGVGAICAVRFLMTKDSGLYGMEDLLTESKPALTISSKSGYSVLVVEGIDEGDCTSIFGHINRNKLPLDIFTYTASVDGTITLALSFDQNKILPEDIVQNKGYSLFETMGKIVIIGIESTSVAFEILRLTKSVGGVVKMMSSSKNTLSIFVDNDSLVKVEYSLKSYFKL